jgi:tetratricopeptide (TPR) repeat protein
MRKLVAAALLALPIGACQRHPAQPPATDTASVAPLSSAAKETRALVEQGKLDEALARLQAASPGDPETLFLQGSVWAKKAESAPLPTPAPAASPLPRGAEPPTAPEFKAEELTAIDFFEKALAARPEHVAAHLALAELLAPHAAHRYDLEEAAKKKRPAPGHKREESAPQAPAAGPDFSSERVAREYQAAIQGDPTSTLAVESMLRFALRAHRADDAEPALKDLVKRDSEKPGPYIRYGDFLLKEKGNAQGAIEQYQQALVWGADDDATRAKIADIYIGQGLEHYRSQEWARAEARFKDAEKWITDKTSPQGITVKEHLTKLANLRGR